MNVPLSVVQDDQGRLRDINGQPMIMIFPSKPRRPRTVRKSCLAEDDPSKTKSQSFAFVNVGKPNEESEESRQLIRTHVMKNYRERVRRKPKASSDSIVLPQSFHEWQSYPENGIPARNDLSNANPLPSPVAGPDPVVFPVQMQPYMKRLIHQYSSSIMNHLDPRPDAKPQSSVWFPMVMTDPALFHAILCTSAIYIDLVSGRDEESFLQKKHMLEAISLINTRLQQVDAKDCVSDATITTILFIAKAECAQRKYVNWDIHMNGLIKIVKIKGGMMKLRDFIRQKIYNTELIGCIETGSIPRFPFIENTVAVGPSIAARPLTSGFEDINQILCMEPNLLSILNEVENINDGVGSLSDIELELTAVQIRYRLLAWINPGLAEDRCSAVEEFIRYGVVLYIRTLIRDPWVRGIDYTPVLSNLRAHLLKFETTCFESTSLLLWLLFVGGITSEGICRSWFTARLVDVTAQAAINTWDGVKSCLVRVWWFESVHERPCRQLWDEVKAIQLRIKR